MKLKGIDGGPHKRWSMWFNSMQREKPYLLLTYLEALVMRVCFWSQDTGAAWLSSARVVRCWVKSRNERNPCPQLPAVRLGTLGGLPVTSRRKVGMTSSPHGLYIQGYSRVTMGVTKGSETVTWSESQKSPLSSDRSLQLDCVKLESLVIGYQP